ncbi:hypothetical protein D7D50_05150 [Streptococcus koreensis]|uniref:Uncharacterized protein n=1 Tax=Streptococcus koreensis TaxID=2382163 RepID=A0ABN5PUS2_9STRE|nr:hypothetical protein D7D50_05150 [Streptococcus koreensis]
MDLFFMSLKTRERIRPLRVFFSDPVDLFFISLKIRKRIKTLTGLFLRAWKCESELRSSGPLFHELENKRANKTQVGLFFRSGGTSLTFPKL